MCYFSRKGASDDNHKRNLQELLKNFDCFGWVPTVGGALSLDIAGQFSCMLGDVDRHFAIFKNYIGLSSEQFITATSLVSVNDRKHGSIYDRNFRYFFLGSIHNSERNEDFINKHNLNKKSSIANFLNSEGALLGSLVIVLDKSYSLTKEEAEIIKLITGLEEQNKKYQDSFTIKADSLAELDNQRKSMKKTWLSIENKVSDIAKNQNYTSYTFDVFLTRDGILS